jgi:hypothetical protein
MICQGEVERENPGNSRTFPLEQSREGQHWQEIAAAHPNIVCHIALFEF